MNSPLVPAPMQEPSALSGYAGTNLAGQIANQAGPDPLKILSRLVASLRRFRWLILGLTLAGLAGGILATRFLDPVYEVQASVWIETPSSEQGRGGPIQGQELLTSGAWMELLRQFMVLDPVVVERRLYIPAAYGPDSTLFTGFGLVSVGRFLAGKYELRVSRDGQTVELVHTQRRTAPQRAQVGDSLGRDLGLLWVPRP
ncbi:MAG: Wzz/FepE/Etk N-terminal domain-containing protein, partial [Actinomycetota bacterium]|nr:Wzz/FepE/Etk N-terminal domain-containing protein [Actinomycetota bacterium]